MLETLILERLISKYIIPNANGILGKVYDSYCNPICVSIERPDLKNQQLISCIPAGTYKCSRDKTGKHKYFKVENVPDRDFIEIHPANKVDELKGCIAFGESWFIKDNNIAIYESRRLLDQLVLDHPKGFYLTIINKFL